MSRILPLVFTAVLLSSCISIKATTTKSISTTEAELYAEDSNPSENPKLIVGIVVDQMRYEYLIRYASRFGEGGFKRLLKEGYHLENAHFDYIPTKTAAGHASVYTGTGPSVHGILGNDWYHKYQKKSVYCVGDDAYESVGATTGGKKSPHRLLTSTITDQLRLTSNLKSKVISRSIKDRGAVLPGGHTANAVYWFEGDSVGRFITSTYYMESLPDWAQKYNESGKINDYLNTPWETLYDINTYTASLADDNPYEGLFKGRTSPTFPYDLRELRKLNKEYNLIKEVPAGNSIITDFAVEALKNEALGKGEHTDFLALSYSSPDYIGHMFGPRSVELEDTYLRLDKEMETLLNALDSAVGKGNYTLFLTADHAVADVPAYLESLNIPAGYMVYSEFRKFFSEITEKHFNSKELIEYISNEQIYLNREKIAALGLDYDTVVSVMTHEVLNFPMVAKAHSAKTMNTTEFTKGIPALLQNGFHQKFSGDILLTLNPSTISRSTRTGTTHGSGYTYDTHVPLLFFGNGIKQGKSDQYYPITAIVPTISSLLNITVPEGCTSNPIIEVLAE